MGRPLEKWMGNCLTRCLVSTLVVGLVLLLAGPKKVKASEQTNSASFTFTGVESIAQSEPCTAFYTFNILGTTVCSVYTGSITGGAAGSEPAAAIINLDISRLDVTSTGCFPIYLNVQFAGASDSQTLYGFGSLCAPVSATPAVQSGAKLTSSGGYGIAESLAGASGTGQFSGTFTPEHKVAGDKLVMTFSPQP